jgi:hypothetical protein
LTAQDRRHRAVAQRQAQRDVVVVNDVAEVLGLALFGTDEAVGQVLPGAEGASLARQHDGAHAGVGGQSLDRLAQLHGQVGGQHVELRGSVQPQHGHGLVAVDKDERVGHGDKPVGKQGMGR